MVTVSNIIPRNNVIAGAVDNTFRVSGASVLLMEVTLDNAAVHDLDSSPVVLLPAPSPGRVCAILGVFYQKRSGGFTGGGVVNINYTDAGNTLVATIAATHFTNSGATSQWATRANQTGALAAQSPPSAGVDISTGTAFTGAGGEVIVNVRYVEVDA